MQKQETILLDEKWMNPIRVSGKHLTCIVCKLIPVGVNNQIECQGCRSLFCRNDFNEIHNQMQNCPGCEQVGISQAKNIHTAVRESFQRSKFSCDICHPPEDKGPKTLYSNKELANHLDGHNLSKIGMKNEQEFELLQYLLTTKSGVAYPFGLSEQIVINFCVYRRERTCHFLGSNQRSLIVDTRDQVAYFDRLDDEMSLTSLPNKEITSLKTYTLWYFRRDRDIIFFDTASQNEIHAAYKFLSLNRRLNEIHIEKEDLLLRINLKEKTIYDTTTQAVYRLEYKEFCFK